MKRYGKFWRAVDGLMDEVRALEEEIAWDERPSSEMPLGQRAWTSQLTRAIVLENLKACHVLPTRSGRGGHDA